MVGVTTTSSLQPVAPELPRRPRLRPGIEAFQRTADELQIGLDPERGVLACNLPPPVAAVLRSLDGRTTLSTLVARAGPEHADTVCKLLRGLAARGLLIDAGQLRADVACESAAVVVRGDGPLAAAVAGLLAAAGIAEVPVQSTGTVGPAEVGGSITSAEVGRPRAAVITRIVQATSPTADTSSLPADRSPDLVVLTDALVPAADVVRRLMSERQEHLVVGVRDGIGVVGPLVLPRRSSCLHCADLHRTDLDRHWPRVANQLAGRCQFADPATTQAVAALAVRQILRSLRPGKEPPPLLNATIELDLAAGTTEHRRWYPHPRCDCGAEPWS